MICCSLRRPQGGRRPADRSGRGRGVSGGLHRPRGRRPGARRSRTPGARRRRRLRRGPRPRARRGAPRPGSVRRRQPAGLAAGGGGDARGSGRLRGRRAHRPRPLHRPLGRRPGPGGPLRRGARLPVAAGAPVDATFRLERNEWQGVVEPRLLLREARACEPRADRPARRGRVYIDRAFAELDAPHPPRRGPAGRTRPAGARAGATGRSPADLRSPGAGDRRDDRRARGERRAGPRRRGRRRRPRRHLHDASAALRCAPTRRSSARRLSHASYPQWSCSTRRARRLERAAGRRRTAAECGHLAWGEPELRFALHTHQQEFGLRTSLAGLYRVLRDLGSAAGEGLEAALRGDAAQPRSPELAGRLLRVFLELGLVELDRQHASVGVRVGRRAELEGSPAFCDYQRRLEDGQRYLGKSASSPSGERRAA